MKPFAVAAAAALLCACGANPEGAGPAPESDGGPSEAAALPDAAPRAPACDALSPRTVPLELHVLPDEGEEALAGELRKATRSIRVMVYEMGYGAVLDALKERAGKGVAVSVILDVGKTSINQKYFDQLTQAGAAVHWSDPRFPYMHAKTLVVDEAVAVISTGNYLVTNVLKERNYVATDRDPDDVDAMVGLFDADFARQEPDLTCTRLLVSPLNARERLIALIDSATKTLDIESMQFADAAVRTAVANRAAAGVTVRVLLADPGWIDTNTAAAAFLGASKIPAKYLTSPTVHVKAIVVDGARAYVGSENVSYTSLSKNREVGLISDQADVITTMNQTFEGDWAKAQSF